MVNSNRKVNLPLQIEVREGGKEGRRATNRLAAHATLKRMVQIWTQQSEVKTENGTSVGKGMENFGN